MRIRQTSSRRSSLENRDAAVVVGETGFGAMIIGVCGLGECDPSTGVLATGVTTGLSASNSKGPTPPGGAGATLPRAMEGEATLNGPGGGGFFLDSLRKIPPGPDPSNSITGRPPSSGCRGVGHIFSRAASPSAIT